MDELDSLIIGKTLEGGWVVQEPRHVQRDSPSACRAYLARNAKGANAFVKVPEICVRTTDVSCWPESRGFSEGSEAGHTLPVYHWINVNVD